MHRAIDIIPGRDCNFRCAYCFERRSDDAYVTSFMHQDVINAVISYIHNMQNWCNGISLCFFGGEPLLHTDVLDKIIRGVPSDIGHEIITNGSLVQTNESWLLDIGRHSQTGVIVSYDYALQDKNRQAESYGKIRDNILWLYKNKLLRGVITTLGYADLGMLYDVFYDFLRLRHAIPRLELLLNIDGTGVATSYDEQSFINSLVRVREYLERTGNYNIINLHMALPGRRGCADGTLCAGVHSGIDVDGSLYTTYNAAFFPQNIKDLLYLGNVRDNFSALQNRHAELYRNLNTELPKKCQECTALCRVNPWTTVRTSVSEANGMPSELRCRVFKLFSEYIQP